MFGSAILEVAIGLVYLFAMVALMCAAVRECIEAVLKTKAAYLERGIREVLHDVNGAAPSPGGKTLTEDLYQHPLVNSLFCADYVRSQWNKKPGLMARGRNLPSYIPSRSFALAILDIMGAGNTLVAAVQTNPFKGAPGPVSKALSSLVELAQGDVEKAIANVEHWYDDAMDRVSSKYRRVTQLFLFLIGFATAAVVNVDTLAIARTLYTDTDTRSAVVELARHVSPSEATPVGKSAVDQIKEDKALPIGWAGEDWRWDENAATRWKHVLTVFGWMITGLAATLGAPFWFDTLNRLTNLRTSLKPEKQTKP
jgi:hypothetical protein